MIRYALTRLALLLLGALEFAAILRHNGTNALLTLDIEGEEQLALPKQIDIHPLTRVIEHTDLLVVKKGEKIDYAIMREGRVNILIEVKKVGAELSLAHASQLVRYFHTSEARIGVLTNGRLWNF